MPKALLILQSQAIRRLIRFGKAQGLGCGFKGGSRDRGCKDTCVRSRVKVHGNLEPLFAGVVAIFVVLVTSIRPVRCVLSKVIC